MNVNNFDSFNRYCGPAVLSIFTGATPDDCAEEIGKVLKSFKVTGVHPGDLMKAGEAMGLAFKNIPSFTDRSIFWAGTVMIKLPPSLYLVSTLTHYIALEVRDGSIYLCDNHTKTEIELQNSSRLGMKIQNCWSVKRAKAWSKPVPVKSEFGCQRNGDHIDIRQLVTYSDGAVKVNHCGHISITDKHLLQEIAFSLMELTK